MKGTAKTSWHYAEGTDEQGNKVVAPATGTKTLTESVVEEATSWNYLTIGALFGIAAGAYLGHKKGIKGLLTYAAIGAFVGWGAGKTVVVIMKK